MEAFVALALKSLLVAGAGLALLALLKKRSPAERSWIAHITLAALLLLPLAPLALPALHVRGPQFLSTISAPVAAREPASVASSKVNPEAVVADEQASAALPAPSMLSNVEWTKVAYWTPAAVLLLMTLLAVARLVALRSRAEVLVDERWLSALARAQRRMGFKHGTALLISDELASPISWGLVRPVILLNTRAVEAADEAEAIIAHELAHVARLDWAKLLLARVVTAMFWFNPLVWLLSREAHQLREESADDAVLGADIPDTDYAQLLVGVARHECRGLLIGAHGVAPSKGSLARRVARVLDSGLARGPAARSFAAGVFVGAAALAAPLAAITLSPELPAPVLAAAPPSQYYPGRELTAQVVESAVASSVAGTVALAENDQKTAVGPSDQVSRKSPIETAIAAKAVGATPEYLRSIRAAAPNLGGIDGEDLVALKAVGVSPEYIRDLVASGQRNLDADDIMQARAMGVSGSYIRGMAAAGYPNLTMNELVQMKAVGVTVADVHKLKKAGYGHLSADQIVQFKAVSGSDNDPDAGDDPPDEDDGS